MSAPSWPLVLKSTIQRTPAATNGAVERDVNDRAVDDARQRPFAAGVGMLRREQPAPRGSARSCVTAASTCAVAGASSARIDACRGELAADAR